MEKAGYKWACQVIRPQGIGPRDVTGQATVSQGKYHTHSSTPTTELFSGLRTLQIRFRACPHNMGSRAHSISSTSNQSRLCRLHLDYSSGQLCLYLEYFQHD